MQGDEEREADAEHDQGNEEVAVSEDGAGLLSKFHSGSVGLRGIDWRKHKDLAVGVSRSPHRGCKALPIPVREGSKGASSANRFDDHGRRAEATREMPWRSGVKSID